jgi:hypothetical protein
MIKMQLQFSKELLVKLKQENSLWTVIDYTRNLRFVDSIILYVLNWKYQSKAENLIDWLDTNCEISDKIKSDLDSLKNSNQSWAKKIQQILIYVNKNIVYKPDQVVWKVGEYWQTPAETWKLKTGDCEDGAVLIYCIAKWMNFPDEQIYIVAGDVSGGGHCYVVFRDIDNDALEYPIDWCYWFDISKLMKIPYMERAEYYGGESEWFRFNSNGNYKPRR